MFLTRALTRPMHLVAVLGALLLALGLAAMTAQAASAAQISGEVGETVDPEATPYGGYMLRYVGDPAPAGYSHEYQWDNPFISTQPETGPVTFEGTLDLTGRQAGDVSMIGLLDQADLEAGNHSFQQGAYIYAFAMGSGNVRLGVTDGNAGGELVQAFMTVPAATADAGPLDVTFTVDGTADPATCASPAGSGGAATGCMTLTVDGIGTVTDSYGTIRAPAGATPEFADGAIPGWESYGPGPTGVLYDFAITPAAADPQNADACKKGGWESYGFRNQGECVRYVQTGKDGR